MRYIVHSGYVKSKTDGDVHWVGFGQLCRLYGLQPHATDVFNGDRCTNLKPLPDDIHLHPRVDGDYTLPKSQ
jgi:hypothetical protein